MNWQRAQVIILALLLASCSGGRLPENVPAQSVAEPIAMLAAPEVSVELSGDGNLRIVTGNAHPAGWLAELEAPLDLPDGGFFSLSRADCLVLAAVRAGELQICAAPLPGCSLSAATFELQAADALSREGSIAAKDNRIRDLLIESVADNYYQLSWTAINLGDYDQNGEVNVADLIPLARHLGESTTAEEPWTRQNPRYWIDGDGNNNINISDLTTIARFYGNSIDHYDLLVKGQLLQQVPYADGIPAAEEGLPPHFSVLVPSASVNYPEEISLVPVRYDNKPTGPPSNSMLLAELAVSAGYAGMELLNLCPPAKTPAAAEYFQPADPDLANCYETFRLIDPIDNPGHFDPPLELAREFGKALFNGLDREKLCYLQTDFLPGSDLATGQPNAALGPDSPGLLRIAYPLKLPNDGRSYRVEQSFSSVANPAGGAFLDILATSNIPGGLSPAPIRLSPGQARLARDLDGDGDYGNETWLQDADLNGLSDALEEQLRTGEKYYVQQGVQVVGTVQDVLPEKGEIQLSRAYEYDDSGSEAQFETLTLRFTELSGFAQANPLNQSLDPTKIRASELRPGSQLSARCSLQRLGPTGDPVNFWAQEITQLEPIGEPNSILIVPALTERRPGQVVNVTVYASDSSSPFNSLERMTLHVLGGAEIVPGSVNPGIQGGADDAADGIWALLGPQGVQVEASIYQLGFSGGKYYQNFDISIRPVSSLNITGASGALFNFDLRIYEPAVVLAGYRYSPPVSHYADAQGNEHDWISQDDEDSLFVSLTAAQPEVLLPDGAESGSGTYYDPYIVFTGRSYPLQVLDEIDGDISSNANCWYVVSPDLAGYIDYSNPVLSVPPEYTGSFSVSAVYPGNLSIPPIFSRRTYFVAQ